MLDSSTTDPATQCGYRQMYQGGPLVGNGVWNLKLTYEIQASGQWFLVGGESMGRSYTSLELDAASTICARLFLTERRGYEAPRAVHSVLIDGIPFQTPPIQFGQLSQS